MEQKPTLSWWKEIPATALLFLPTIISSRKNVFRFLAVLAFLLSDVLIAAWIPFFGKRFVESVSGGLREGIFITFALWSVLWLVEKLVRPVQDLIFFPVINQTIRNLYYRVIGKIHSLPWAFSKKESVGEVISRMKRISQSARFFFRTCCLGFLPTFGKLCILTFFLIQQPVYASAVAICILLYVWVIKTGLDQYLMTRDRAWKASDYVTEQVHHSLANRHVARFFRESEMEKIGRHLDTEAEAWLLTNRAQNGFQIRIGLVMTFSLIGLSCLGMALVQWGGLSVGDFVWIQGQCVALFLPMKLLSIELRQFQESVVDIKSVRELLELEDPTASFSPTESSRIPISFRNVRFSYFKDQVLLNDISLQIREGERVALSGSSGAGKTTLAYLMTGMFFPQEGEIRIFGQKTVDFEAEELRPFVQHLSSQGGIFPGTFRENLSYGAKPSDNEIWEVVELVGLQEIVEDLSEEVPLGDLSHGERIRVLLGRALLAPPKVLILDEVMQALEPEEEKRLLLLLGECVPTLIQISHRPPHAGFFDRQWILKGAMVEESTSS